MPNRYCLILLALLFSVLLSSCGTQPDHNRPTQDNAAPMSQAELERAVGRHLEKARNSQPPEREQLLLAAAELLHLNDQADWTLNILQSIPVDALDDTTYIRYADLYSDTAMTAGRYGKARELLDSERLLSLTLTPAQHILLTERRATIDSRLGDYTASLRERIRLGQQLQDADAVEFNNEAIWQDLMSLTVSELNTLAGAQPPTPETGWAELALLARNNAANLNAQLNQLEQWQAQWPTHPANRHLPTDLQLLRQLVAEQPRKIALLLPQKGRLAGAATAVRDGFLAAYYTAPASATRPEIRQYDTSGEDIITVYQQAITDGATLIVGPLAKEHVEMLAQIPLSVPVLALNYREDSQQAENTQTPAALAYPIERRTAAPLAFPAMDNAFGGTPEAPATGSRLFTPRLFQFGLAAEDEARQIARLAAIEGHRRAMIIAPDADWAMRSVEAFSETWNAGGGQIVARSIYVGAGDYSAVIKRSLLIDKSEERQQELRSILGHGSEFEPRSRQDVDMIFLIATPSQARQIKPTLAFHYAGHLPVYATSQIYTGETNTGDRDLSGIRFNTLPWLFDNDSPEKQAIAGNTQNTPAAYTRLQAMGADAYHLYPRLPQLERLSEARVFGATGILSVKEDGRIERELIWARFVGGEARPMPNVVDHNDTPDEH